MALHLVIYEAVHNLLHEFEALIAVVEVFLVFVYVVFAWGCCTGCACGTQKMKRCDFDFYHIFFPKSCVLQF